MSHAPRPSRDLASSQGFTLLETLVATFVFAVVMGGLMQVLTKTTAALARARVEIEASELAESRLREIEDQALKGELPQPGRTEGTFEAPSEHLAWILDVEPFAIPLPPELARREERPASVFEQRRGLGEATPILSVTLRVYPVEGDPERALPFLLYVVRPLS